MQTDPIARSTNRVADYIRCRPSYPAELVPVLQQRCGLSTSTVIADVGSGTGQLTRLFLAKGNRVYGVEPNSAMRQAAADQLAVYPQFYRQPGRAEATGLPAASVDMVVAGQAFHWFEPQQSRREFQRILSPGGWVVLVWNNRDLTNAFQQAYESLLLQYAPEYPAIRQRRQVTLAQVQRFYAPNPVFSTTLPYLHSLDWAGLWGRLQSCSYAPPAAHPNTPPLRDALKQAFEGHQRNGQIDFVYQTLIYGGRLL